VNTASKPQNPAHATAAAVEFGEQLLSQSELRAFLNVGRTTAWRLRRRRHDPLPSLGWGGKVLFDAAEIRAWLARQRFRRPAPRAASRAARG